MSSYGWYEKRGSHNYQPVYVLLLYLSKKELSSQSADVVLNYNFAQNTPYLVKNFPQPHVAYYIEQVIK